MNKVTKPKVPNFWTRALRDVSQLQKGGLQTDAAYAILIVMSRMLEETETNIKRTRAIANAKLTVEEYARQLSKEDREYLISFINDAIDNERSELGGKVDDALKKVRELQDEVDALKRQKKADEAQAQRAKDKNERDERRKQAEARNDKHALKHRRIRTAALFVGVFFFMMIVLT